MNHNLIQISPVDGRYGNKTEALQSYFSEFALIKYRVTVELQYFIALSEIPLPGLNDFSSSHKETIDGWLQQFSLEDALAIKNIEKTTNHDVKAVEYWIKSKFDEAGWTDWKEFIHLGLTSQDINNTAMPMMVGEAVSEVIIPQYERIISKLSQLAEEWASVPMLARTHGQPASPTKLGKEIQVFVYRLERQLSALKEIKISGKFGGATGNFNAHLVSYPEVDWIAFAEKFLSDKLHIDRQKWTTQIENYDDLASIFQALSRLNTILIDLSRDLWQYISTDYFKQKIVAGEVGSSAMPHKVNPIDFENAEGNLGIANALFQFLANKLPISRLQRDLTDSTVTRNIGVPMAHTFIALQSLAKGLNKIVLNPPALERDLEANWAVVAEAIQNILRREKYPNPYETLKALTRTSGPITETTIKSFIETLEVSDAVKKELLQISPFNYTGY